MFDPDHPEKNFIFTNEAVEDVIEVEADAAVEGIITTVKNEEIISPEEPRYPDQALIS